MNTLATVRLLVVSVDLGSLRPLWRIAESNSWSLETARNCWDAMDRLQADSFPHVLLLDLPPGAGNDLHLLRWLQRLRPELGIVVACHSDDANTREDALRLGAATVLIRPFDERELEAAIQGALDSSPNHAEVDIGIEHVEPLAEDEFFLSVSPLMQKVRAQAELLAQCAVPALIVGEPGSGKVTVAHLIHKLSVRSGFAFHRLHCGRIPGTMLEAELFGREAGSSTNSIAAGNSGKLSRGEHGTLLLQEISEMPLSLQSALAEFLQQRQIGKEGIGDSARVGPRILAASTGNLDQAVEENRLRADLHQRLAAFTIHVPALRRRRDEIAVLLGYSMHKLARHYGLPAREFTEDMLVKCVNHSWPGNLREMETVVKRYLVTGEVDLNLDVPGSTNTPRNPAAIDGDRSFTGASKLQIPSEKNSRDSTIALKTLIQNVKSLAERNAITVALQKTHWNRKAAARLLQVSYRTMLYKIEQYQISSSDTNLTDFLENEASVNENRR